ncbi:MAG: hypothetical protein IKE77_09285 [Erysipelotrichaceae bacterium]|nr:hypothetical protein [Erysipelotrichaceae bacterium]
MFNNEDILTLARAGFTAQQIAALNQVQQPVAPEVAPAAPEAPEAPVTPPTAAPHTVDDVLSAITGLSQQMQQNNLLNMTQVQPAQKTATEVLAQIINPPTKKEV